jgi:UDP-N-acetylglucosamine 2-epimerase (non-hydrolysing)
LTNEKSKKIILVTAHRRENFGKPLENICNALRELADRYKEEIFIVYAVHLNPNVWDTAHKLLSGIPNIALTAPLDYLSTINIMKRAYLIVTDSGGIQEEAPALGKPVLVLRNITERPEAVKAGTVQLVGTEEDNIIKESVRLLEDYRKYKRMSQAINPYGDGKASARIIAALLGKKISEFRL